MASSLVWLWVMGVIVSVAMGLGLVSGYSGSSVVGCACGAGLAVLWVTVK